MQFGFGAPVSGPLSGPKDLARIVAEGERIGYDYCTISDHVMIPRDMEAKYPYSDTGEFRRDAHIHIRGFGGEVIDGRLATTACQFRS